MKPVVILLAASALAAGMVVGGVVLASAALAPEDNPHSFTSLDIKDLWTLKPVRIDRSVQNLERLPPRYASHVAMSEPATHPDLQTARTTGSDEASKAGRTGVLVTADDAEIMNASATTRSHAAPAGMEEHITACMQRYRSYRISDNTYQPYGGGPRQTCEPWSF